LNIGPEEFQAMNDFQDYAYKNIQVHFPKYFILPRFLSETAYRYQYLQFYRQVKRVINIDEYDHVLSYFCDPAGLAVQKLSEEEKIPHSIVIQENSGWFNELAEQKRIQDMWRDAENIFRVNPNDIDLLKQYNENTHYVPNGYDPDVFYPLEQEDARDELGLDQDETILVNVAALKIHHKNQLNLVRAFSKLQETHPSQLYLVGEGPDRGRIKEEVKELGLNDKVHLVGRVPHEKVKLWMNAADLFVLPSYHEGNPTVMFECMATGTPQVLSDVGGIPEALPPSSGKIIDNHNSVDSICAGIEEALQYSWKKEDIQNQSKNYTWKGISDEITTQLKLPC
jgi:glycosyltransferase involved in cell wall biosynthesis